MKKIVASLMVVLMAGVVITGFWEPSYASDWDKAGKIFAAVEGVRILTGGKVDLIGRITGIKQDVAYKHASKCDNMENRCCSKRVWLPNIVWKRKYIPEHKEYSEKYGTIIVEGHYIRYQTEKGGRWVSKCDCN